VFAIARRRGIRPITIGRQLVATMDDIALSNNGVVPSTYKVLVSPSNLELLNPTLKPLSHELRQAVAHHATYEGYSLAGEAVITFEHDENLGPFECVIRSSQVSSVRATPVEPIATEPAPRKIHALVLEDGTRFELVSDQYSIGRQTTCDIVIADHNVSRVHAELKVAQGMWRIDDRGSTNGTRVNGTMIAEPTSLASGDVIAFGAVNIRFE
jgi:pSer/pThr/pTyr-binding forkhead associated (FHA) protein